jgi:hypothetical protein
MAFASEPATPPIPSAELPPTFPLLVASRGREEEEPEETAMSEPNKREGGEEE